jgi:hypothetical protein
VLLDNWTFLFMKKYERGKSKDELKKSIVESVDDPDRVDFILSETLQRTREIGHFREECKQGIFIVDPAEIDLDTDIYKTRTGNTFFLERNRMN